MHCKRVLICLSLVLLMSNLCFATVAESLQNCSVTVQVGYSSGSGMLIVRKFGDQNIAFVITAAHVVKSARKERKVTVNGNEKTLVEFDEVVLATERVHQGRKVGEDRRLCRVIKYNEEHDIAVLRVLEPDYRQVGVEFYLEDKIPGSGTRVLHVGSPGGSALGAHSVTDGIVSAVGRILPDEKYELDQTTAGAAPGSSGGLLALESNGKVIGIITAGISQSDSFNYYIPVRRLLKWLKEVDLLWLADPSRELPKFEDLDNIVVDDAGRSVSGDKKSEEENVRTPVSVDRLPTVIETHDNVKKTD